MAGKSKQVDRADSEAPTPDGPAERAVNHRTVVGRRRRAQTEARIIQAAIQIFAERGPDAPVIEDFINAAGIARGTFYNYFRSTDELLGATSDWLSEELIAEIDTKIRSLGDPAVRFGTGIRLWMAWAVANPSSCLFIARVWNMRAHDRPIRDIREGIRKKEFLVPDAYVAWDVVTGAFRQAMLKIGGGAARPDYADSVVRLCLQALGVRTEKIREIMALPLPH